VAETGWISKTATVAKKEVVDMIFTLIEDGNEYETVDLDCIADALSHAVTNVDRANYPAMDDAGETTLYVKVEARCAETGRTAGETVTLHPDEPECSRAAHSWCSPYVLVGGDESNPGVRGHGGGVLIHTVCRHCLVSRWRDTWAQNPENGEQGLESISYDTEFQGDEAAEKWAGSRTQA